MKKLFTLLLLAALCIALVACGTTPVETNAGSADPANTDAVAPAEDAIKTLKIGAFSNSTKDDGGYTRALWRDLQAVAAEYGMSEDQIILVENIYDGTPDVATTIEGLIDEGCSIIIAHSNGYCDVMVEYAKKNPDVRFYCYEGMDDPSLVVPYTINNLEVMYLMGYLCAGQSGDVNELGFIAPMQNSHIIRSMDAFAIGAKAYNPDATVKVMWVNSWWDMDTDKLCAETLIGEGIKCIAYYGSTSAALQACEEKGAFCTGFHVDMHDFAPNACMTSFMWNWQPIIAEMVERYIADSDDMSIISGNMSTGCAAMADIDTNIVSAELIEKVNAMMAKAQKGEIDVFAGPVMDNQGNEVVAAGQTIEEKDLTSVFFLVDNVIGQLD